MKKAWTYQRREQIEKYGADKASWYCAWYEPGGALRSKSCGSGSIGRTAAKRLADLRHSELVTGTYKPKQKMTWEKLRSDYSTKIACRFDVPSRLAVEIALDNFQRVAKPHSVAAIDVEKIDDFIAKRLKESACKGSSAPEAKKKNYPPVSPATVNKELRYLRMILNVAKEWRVIQDVPKIRFLKVPKKLPTYIPESHFEAIYKACGVARKPYGVPNLEPAVWWRGLLTMAYMTGWRISQLLSLTWDDIDFEDGSATSRAEAVGNKGKREERVPLHPIVLSHLKQLAGSFDKYVFPWYQNKRDLWPEFHAIQATAKLSDDTPLPKGGKGGRPYSFHDCRRGYATNNAALMDLFTLQQLMQHKSLETTREYVSMALRLKEPVQNLFVPQSLRLSETA